MFYTAFMRYMGIDYGSRRVGVALSDELGTMGFPHSIITNTPRLLDEICALIAKEHVAVVVMGESQNFSGEDNPIAKEARAFSAALTERTGVAVQFEPEVLTSEEARQAPAKVGKTRSPKKHTPIDDSAAALILTSYLSRVDAVYSRNVAHLE